MSEIVGTVVEITRFPVKSMAGERMSSAEVDWQGIEGDRQFAFYQVTDKGRFPWLTARELPQLLLYRPGFRDPALPRLSGVDVTTPDGRWVDLQDDGLRAKLSEDAGVEVALLQLGRGTHDAMPISLISTATHAALDQAHGSRLEPRRFRSNLMIDWDRSEAALAGKRISFGGWDDAAELLIAAPIPRCAMVTIDPDDATRNPRIMRLVVEQFANEVGIYATPSRPGRIRLGDKVMATG